MKNIAIISNKNKDVDYKVTQEVVDRLRNMGFVYYLDSQAAEYLCEERSFEILPEFVDLLVVIGGDGSVLDASVDAIRCNIPILGINLGKVGYLSEVDTDRLDCLYGLATGDYEIESKMLLSTEVIKDGVGAILDRLSVNDVVISHDSFLGIAEFRVEDSVGNSLRYRADGLIVSTPQGSTAYSLSSGGPIVAHNVYGIILTPVSPHSFFNRSVILNADDSITVTNTGDGELKISIDGRPCEVLGAGCSCIIRKAKKTVKVLTFAKNSMFTNLFKKMKILEDMD